MDTLILQIFFLIMKINNFPGDLSDISAKTASLELTRGHQIEMHLRKHLKFRRRTVGPLIIESLWAGKLVSTGALEALNDLLVVRTKN